MADKVSFSAQTILKAGQGFLNVAPQVDELGRRIQGIRDGELSGNFWDDVAHDKFVQIAQKHETTLKTAQEHIRTVGQTLVEIANKMPQNSEAVRGVLR